jgi:hypothetical protein
VAVDFINNFAGKMRGPVGHSLTRKGDGIWRKKKLRRDHANDGKDNPFHVLSLLFIS